MSISFLKDSTLIHIHVYIQVYMCVYTLRRKRGHVRNTRWIVNDSLKSIYETDHICIYIHIIV